MSTELAIKIVRKVSAVPRETWDGLLGSGSPFMKWDWLDSFEQTGCVNEETGWLPHHLVVEKARQNCRCLSIVSQAAQHGRVYF